MILIPRRTSASSAVRYSGCRSSLSASSSIPTKSAAAAGGCASAQQRLRTWELAVVMLKHDLRLAFRPGNAHGSSPKLSSRLPSSLYRAIAKHAAEVPETMILNVPPD